MKQTVLYEIMFKDNLGKWHMLKTSKPAEPLRRIKKYGYELKWCNPPYKKEATQ